VAAARRSWPVALMIASCSAVNRPTTVIAWHPQ
jgi:hypothetical protein